MTVLFVSDVHLSAERPRVADAFCRFLAGPARHADALYLLGDVFDEWLGDDDDRPPHRRVEASLAALHRAGVRLGLLHGNHDFLIGERFVSRAACPVLEPETVVEVRGRRVLLMHGDELCTRDGDYQALRARVRDPRFQREFLALPRAEREARAAALRAGSAQAVRGKAEAIMDVSPEAVADALARHDAAVLVHGHTHRPAVHHLAATGRDAPCRIVLGDWYAGPGRLLAWDATGPRLAPPPDRGGAPGAAARPR